MPERWPTPGFEKAVVGLDTFADQFQATLEAAHELNIEDPTLAQFLGSSRVDAARTPVLSEALRAVEKASPIDFFDRMIDFGIETGEIAAVDRPLVTSLVRTVTVGLTDAVSGDATQHRNAVDAISRLMVGSLLRSAD